MEGFREGYDFFQSHAGNFVGVSVSQKSKSVFLKQGRCVYT